MDTPAIQLIPPGLLGAFQIKSGGQNPARMGDSYVPVLPMLDWALNALREDLIDVNSFGAGNGPRQTSMTNCIVPAAQWWYVHHASIQITLASTDSQVNPAIGFICNAPTVLLPKVVLEWFPLTVTATGTSSDIWVHAERFFMPPGARLYYFSSAGTVSVGTNATAHMVFSRLPN
jgi:hypothetical protein